MGVLSNLLRRDLSDYGLKFRCFINNFIIMVQSTGEKDYMGRK